MRLCLIASFALLAGCTPAPNPVNGDGDGFAFTYVLALGRDCFMMGDCGYRLTLSPDGTLRRFDEGDQPVASIMLTPEERAALLERLEAGGFFGLPPRLPEGPDEEMTRGGRVVTMRFESADGSRRHEVEAHTDVQMASMPETFYAIDEAVRTYLLDRLGR